MSLPVFERDWRMLALEWRQHIKHLDAAHRCELRADALAGNMPILMYGYQPYDNSRKLPTDFSNDNRQPYTPPQLHIIPNPKPAPKLHIVSNPNEY